MTLTKDRPVSNPLRIAIQKAMTKAIIGALRKRQFREAYLDLISIAGAPQVNPRRVSRLRNVLVTRLDHELQFVPVCGHYQAKTTMMEVRRRAACIPAGWLAVEGGAA